MMRTIKKTMLVLSLALCLLTGGSLVAPAPAHAGVLERIIDFLNFPATVAEWTARLAAMGKKIAVLGQIISVISNIYTLITDGFGIMTDLVKNDGRLNALGQEGLALTKQRLTQIEMDTAAADAKLAADLKFVADYAAPKNEYLCKATLIHQLAATTEDFERGISRLALKAIESMYRGPIDDGSGPMYAFDEETLRCSAGFGNPVVDGYDSSCSGLATTTVGEDTKRSFIDDDLTPFSMDGAIPLEVSSFTSKAITLPDGKEITVSVPDPINDNQRMWIAGLYYCFQLAGPRPTPAWGEDKMTRPQGLVERARFDHALAMQSAMVKPCTDLLAYYTRPNLDDSASKALIDKQQKSCVSAKGYIDGHDLEVKFSNCLSPDFRGLSAYQAELLSHSMCKSEHHHISLIQAGATQPELINETIKCSAAWNTWQAKVAAKQGALVDAVTGIQGTKSNWMGIGGTVAGLTRAEEGAAHRVVKDVTPKARPIVPQEIKAERFPPLPQTGIPFAPDEMAWPMAVSQ